MRSRSSKALFPLLGAALLACAAPAAQTEERALEDLVALQQAQPPGNATILEAFRRAEPRVAGSPLQGVVRCLYGRQLLHARLAGEAATAFSNALSTARQPAVVRASDECARRWLTRLDRERVRRALLQTYRRDVAYPDALASLAAVPGDDPPPLEDRWGRPWHYRPVALKHFPDLRGQTYVLESTSLGPLSDLDRALQGPCPAEPPLKAVRSMPGGVQTIQFERAGAEKRAPIVLAEGGSEGGTLLAYVGERLLVLAEGDCWFIVPRPPP